MKQKSTPMAEEHLKSLEGMGEAGTDDFFYTRLRARMENKQESAGWNFPLKPVWLLATLVILLFINGLMLSQQFRVSRLEKTSSSPLENFAQAYDQSINSTF